MNTLLTREAGGDADAEWEDEAILVRLLGYRWVPVLAVGTLVLIPALPSLAGLLLRWWR